MAKTSIDIPQLRFNKMSTAKYEELKLAGQLVDNEFYITPDVSSSDIPTISSSTNDYVLSNDGNQLNWIQESEYTKNRIDSKLNGNVITNCLTKIPQDIKLELSEDGTLTLKAGSKVYKGDGTAVNITSDVSSTNGGISTGFKLLFTSGTGFGAYLLEQCISSNTSPGAGYQIWFNTSDKIIYRDDSKAGNFKATNWSLPIAIITTENSTITSINQVFNGFGYIGSTIFALPGVEGLIPNGRNPDGSLNNTKFKTSSVLTSTNNVKYSGNLALKADFLEMSQGGIYNQDTNYNIAINGTIYNRCFCGKFEKGENGRITSFNPNTTFQAIDRNDTEWASTASKPSNRYVDIPLQASGAQYIAPANGYFYLRKSALNTNYGYVEYTNNNTGIVETNVFCGGTPLFGTTFSTKKGESIVVKYANMNETTNIFRFVYDEGVK